MGTLSMYLPFLIPLLIMNLTLAITAFIHVLRHPKYRFGNKIFWCAVVLLIQIIGPIFYFLVGRGDE